MENLINDFIQYLKIEKNYSIHTIDNYKIDLLAFEKFVIDSKENINKIDHKFIRKYLNDLYNKNYSKATISRNISSLRSFFKYLTQIKIIENNPMLLISNPKKEMKLPNYIDYNDLEQIFNIPNDGNILEQRNHLILELLYSTGIRVSELINIKIKNINKDDKKIKILGKGNKERYVLYGKKCEQLLNSYINDSRKEILKGKQSDYLLISNNGKQLTTAAIRIIINKIVKQGALKLKVSPHTLRHTFATHMLNEGADLKTVQELLGHENLSSTQVYTHVSNEHLRNVYLSAHPRARK